MPPVLLNFLSAQVLFFLLFGVGALATCLVMVLNPNPVRSALFLVLNLFCVAVLYLLLNAYFLAVVQIIVYAGAIMVLFLFVIMLLNLGTPDRQRDRLQWQQPVAILGGLVLVGLFSATIYSSVPAVPERIRGNSGPQRSVFAVADAPTAGGVVPLRSSDIPSDSAAVDAIPLEKPNPETMGTVFNIGKTLYNPNEPWLFPFEITSVLLLVAVIGSVVLAGRRRPGEDFNIPANFAVASANPAEPANPYAMEDDEE
jgi:NADH-quinone oxidoreductase subunit J